MLQQAPRQVIRQRQSLAHAANEVKDLMAMPWVIVENAAT